MVDFCAERRLYVSTTSSKPKCIRECTSVAREGNELEVKRMIDLDIVKKYILNV